jgi:hypothetical protein
MLLIRVRATFAMPFMHAEVDGDDRDAAGRQLKFEGQTDAGAGPSARGRSPGRWARPAPIADHPVRDRARWRRALDWRIPVAIVLSGSVLSGLLWLIDAERYPSPVFMLLSGGLLFGAVYMATDPVSRRWRRSGAWIFGIGVGLLVVLIRVWGGLPEGVMYAILLMNAASPLIERIAQPRPFGREKAAVSEPDIPSVPRSRAVRLAGTLALAGLLSGLALAMTYDMTLPRDRGRTVAGAARPRCSRSCPARSEMQKFSPGATDSCAW